MADYTRLIELKVNDRQIKQATDRLFRSLDRIEKKLDVIAGKGFDGIGASANKAAKSVGKLNAAFTTLSKGSRSHLLRTTAAFAALGAAAPQIEAAARQVPILGGALGAMVAPVNKLYAGISTLASGHLGLTAAIGGSVAAYTLLGSNITKLIPQTFKLGKTFRQFTDSIPGKIAEVSGAFDKLNQKIELTTNGLIELAKGEGLKGLKSLMSTAVLEQEKLLSSNSLYLAQVIKVREVESAVNQELIARQRILDRVIQKEGITAGPGLSGLQKTLREQEAILNRMLTTEEGFSAQVAKVKSIEELINQELRQRDLLMGKINIKEEKSVSLLQRAKDAAGGMGRGAASVLRPGAGAERRGMGAAGLGAAGLATTGAFKLQNYMAAHSTVGIGKFTVGMKIAAAKATGFMAVLDGLGKALIAQPQLLGLAAVAYMAFGKKAFTVPERAAAKLLNTSLGLGTALGKALAPEVARINTELNFTADSARKLNAELNRLPNMQRKVQKGIAISRASGFGSWSREADANISIQKSIERHSKKIEKHTATSAQIQVQQRNMGVANQFMGAGGYGPMPAPGPGNLWNTFRGANTWGGNQAGPMYMSGANRLKGGISSAMIGGGFPLLFGQGGASAIGGGIGGALGGGLLGGGFGFGLSVVGTALGQAVSQADEFDKSLTRLNANVAHLGDDSKITAKDVKQLAKNLGSTKEEAMAVLSAFSEFDSAGVKKSLASVYGSDSDAAYAAAGAQRQAELAQLIFDSRKKIQLTGVEQLFNQLKVNDAATVELALQEAIVKAEERKTIEQVKRITLMDRFMAGMSSGGIGGGAGGLVDPSTFGQDRADRKQAEFDESREQRLKDVRGSLERIREILKDLDTLTGKMGKTIPGAIGDIEDRLKQLKNPTYQIVSAAEAIGSAFKDSFRGIIDGSMSAGEAFAAFTKKVASHFLDMAAEIAAQQLTLSILKMFAGAAFASTGPIGSTGMQGSTLGPSYQSGDPALSSFDTGGLGMAEGGYVQGPTNALIGEGGEGEYVIPESKMSAALANYAGGSRGEAVIPGDGATGEVGGAGGGGMGGSIDVRFTSEQINSVSYVTLEQFQTGVQQAAAEGAKRGQQATLRTLQTSTSTRGRLGI